MLEELRALADDLEAHLLRAEEAAKPDLQIRASLQRLLADDTAHKPIVAAHRARVEKRP